MSLVGMKSTSLLWVPSINVRQQSQPRVVQPFHSWWNAWRWPQELQNARCVHGCRRCCLSVDRRAVLLPPPGITIACGSACEWMLGSRARPTAPTWANGQWAPLRHVPRAQNTQGFEALPPASECLKRQLDPRVQRPSRQKLHTGGPISSSRLFARRPGRPHTTATQAVVHRRSDYVRDHRPVLHTLQVVALPNYPRMWGEEGREGRSGARCM